MKELLSIPKKTLKRLAHYHYYLDMLIKSHHDFVSNERLSADLNLSPKDIREDLENLNDDFSISNIHDVNLLLKTVEKYLGYDSENLAIIVGTGNLGKALLNYQGFKTCGLDIIAAFDNHSEIIGTKIADKTVFPMDKLEDIIQRLHVTIGIITSPAESAQVIADKMIEAGIKGIWNFSLAIIKVPNHIVLQNSSLYGDVLKLSHKINKKQ